LEDATKEIGLVQTKSPLPTSKAKQAMCNALVALFTATAYFTLQKSDTYFSNSGTTGP
jgi:hypothetical protein